MSVGQNRLFGLHAARSALEHTPDRVVAAWVDGQRNYSKLTELRKQLNVVGVRVNSANRKQLDQLAGGQNHQGIILEVDMPAELDENDLWSAVEALSVSAFFLVLDHVQDPHNLGACLRSADGAGVHGVVLTKDQSVGLTPTVAKVASGAAETVPVYRVTNLARVLQGFKENNIWVVGADGEAQKTAYETDLNMPMALVMGAEGKGLRRLTRETCDFLVKLPMTGQVESLNLSVATGILLYEVLRQRGLPNSTLSD